MNKKHIVWLTDAERAICVATIRKETGKSEKLRRATILLKADADGPAWDDARISEAVGCRTRTVENVRQAFVLNGFGGTGSRATGGRANAEVARRSSRGETDCAAVGQAAPGFAGGGLRGGAYGTNPGWQLARCTVVEEPRRNRKQDDETVAGDKGAGRGSSRGAGRKPGTSAPRLMRWIETPSRFGSVSRIRCRVTRDRNGL